MRFVKAYRAVKIITSVLMAVLFLTIDFVILYYRDFALYAFYIPIEILFVSLWILLLKFNKNTVYRIDTDNGKISIFTYGGNYFERAERISVKKGVVFCRIFFKNTKLRAYNSSRNVRAFLHKYQKIYKIIPKKKNDSKEGEKK